jgi:hypothetical protein
VDWGVDGEAPGADRLQPLTQSSSPSCSSRGSPWPRARSAARSAALGG